MRGEGNIEEEGAKHGKKVKGKEGKKVDGNFQKIQERKERKREIKKNVG